MSIFQTMNDEAIASLIGQATNKIVYVSPGIGTRACAALTKAMRNDSVTLTVIVDADEDAYRIGYGDHEALATLHKAAIEQQFSLRRQKGLRIGLLVADDTVVIWSPIAQSVESQQETGQPNSVVFSGGMTDAIEDAVGADNSNELPTSAEIGREPLLPEVLESTIERLKVNPPAPFNLAQKSRVFSTRFQFVETELRGAEWTGRKMKLSSFLLNADLPEEIQDVMETQIRPFQKASDQAFEVPLFYKGEPVYCRDGARRMAPATQSDILRSWSEIRDQYLRHVKGFGWLISKNELAEFREKVGEYEETLKTWVAKFRDYASQEENELVNSIVNSIETRLRHAAKPTEIERKSLEEEVRTGLDRMRVIDPKVRVVLKDVSWESSRDDEFTSALLKAFKPNELEGWFEEFTAAKESSKE
jgi:hypothetical protein